MITAIGSASAQNPMAEDMSRWAVAWRNTASIFTSRYSSRAEAISDYGEKMVSSFLEDLDCKDYRVYSDLLIRNGKYTTQIDHIIISRYGIFAGD